MSPQAAHALVGHQPVRPERPRSLIPSLTDHAAIDALAQRAGVHRGAVFAVIKAMQEAA